MTFVITLSGQLDTLLLCIVTPVAFGLGVLVHMGYVWLRYRRGIGWQKDLDRGLHR